MRFIGMYRSVEIGIRVCVYNISIYIYALKLAWQRKEGPYKDGCPVMFAWWFSGGLGFGCVRVKCFEA